MKPPNRKFLPSNLKKYRDEIISLSGVTVKKSKKKNAKKNKDPLSRLSRKQKRKLERKLKHAKNQAFHTKAEIPKLENLIERKPKRKPIDPKEDGDGDDVEMKKAASKVKKEQISKEEFEKKRRLEMLKNDDERDDVEIRKLEKLLHIKKDAKHYKQSFYDDGFDAILDFCDSNKRTKILKNDANAWLDIESDQEKNDEVEEMPITSSKRKNRDSKEEKKSEKDDEESGDSEDEDGFDDDEDEEDVSDEEPVQKNGNSRKRVKFADVLKDESDADEDDLSDDEEEEGNNTPKEDIYGRLVDAKGKVIKGKESKNDKLQKRLKELEEKHVETDKEILTKLSRQINGLLNRLSTMNIHSISTQIIQIFYSNQYTRHDLISTIETLLKNILLNKGSLIPDRLHAEYAALVSILSSNIGIELGATLIQNLILIFNDQFKNEANIESLFQIENKYIDNLLTFLCYLYNFKLFSSVLIFDLINEYCIKYFANKKYTFEKLIDLLIIVLRKIGFLLRKDNPSQLKEFIINLKDKLTELNVQSEGNSRLKFMLESLVAIKNNDIRKLNEAYYSDDQANSSEDIYESIIKRIKTLYSTNLKYNDVQLNIGLNDLLSSNKRGKWWIVGSAWSNEDEVEMKSTEETVDLVTKKQMKKHKSNFSEKLLELARKQHMNTDIRRTIFCIIMSAEDYADAYVKLVKLSLKKQQEREIVYITVHCLLNEKTYNPYYSFIMQKFCDYDRRFKMTLQFHTWDKFKQLTTMTPQQIKNLGLFYSNLIKSKAMSLSILKNVSFGEIDKSMLLFLRTLFINLFETNTEQETQEIFTRISTYPQLNPLRQALKLFITHFLLKNKGKEDGDSSKAALNEDLCYKCELATKCLSISSNNNAEF